MKIKKHIFYQLPAKAKLTLKGPREITNQNTFLTKGLKITTRQSGETGLVHGKKTEEEEVELSIKKVSLKNLEEPDEKKQVQPIKRSEKSVSVERTNPLKLLPIHRRQSHTTLAIQLPKNPSKMVLPKDLEQYKQPFIEIQQSLKKQHLIEPYNNLSLLLKRQKLHEIILKVVTSLIISTKIKNPEKNDPFKRSISAIKRHILKEHEQSKDRKCSLVRDVCRFTYNSSQYQQSLRTKSATLDSLIHQVTHLQDEIQSKTEILNQVVKHHSQKHEEVKHYEHLLYDLQSKIAQEEVRCEFLESKRVTLEHSLEEIEQKYQQLTNFVKNQEKNKILKEVSKDYIAIQSDIYEYAVYLQCNQLASDINYEPHPFSEIEHQTQDELNLLTYILRNQDKTLPQKFSQMREFVASAMGKFKKKDLELLKLNEFKTKCITTFIGKMKKWLNNWELKQEYLVNLKKEFVATTYNLRNALNDLIATPSKDSEKEQFAHILALLSQLELSVSLGNSFY